MPHSKVLEFCLTPEVVSVLSILSSQTGRRTHAWSTSPHRPGPRHQPAHRPGHGRHHGAVRRALPVPASAPRGRATDPGGARGPRIFGSKGALPARDALVRFCPHGPRAGSHTCTVLVFRCPFQEHVRKTQVSKTPVHETPGQSTYCSRNTLGSCL